MNNGNGYKFKLLLDCADETCSGKMEFAENQWKCQRCGKVKKESDVLKTFLEKPVVLMSK